jgi:hypothetical protein
MEKERLEEPPSPFFSALLYFFLLRAVRYVHTLLLCDFLFLCFKSEGERERSQQQKRDFTFSWSIFLAEGKSSDDWRTNKV